MRSCIMCLLMAAAAMTLAACPTTPTTLRTRVPVLACVVNGTAWAASGPQAAEVHVSQMGDAVNAIWNQTNVAFLFLPDPRVIDDPQPPGMKLDVPPYVAKGQLGDVR